VLTTDLVNQSVGVYENCEIPFRGGIYQDGGLTPHLLDTNRSDVRWTGEDTRGNGPEERETVG
jgi:hypothetical protein